MSVSFNFTYSNFKGILLILSLIFVVSCGVHPSKKMSEFIDTFPIGTTESRFTASLDGEELVYSDSEVSIYKVTVSTYNYIHHRRSDFRFFYFHKGILKQIDKGKRATDYKIEIQNN